MKPPAADLVDFPITNHQSTITMKGGATASIA